METMNLFKVFLVSLTFVSASCSKNPIHFYKFSLQWPRSSCSGGTMKCPNPLPVGIGTSFTIHGLWPQDANDEPVDPYSSSHPCSAQPPPTKVQLLALIKSLYPSLTTNWPDLKNPLVPAANEDFWWKEWSKHGTCSDFPSKPFDYFDSALQIKLQLPASLGLSSGTTQSLQDIFNAISSAVKAKPELACNRNASTNKLQLWEVRLCYERPAPNELVKTIRDCPSSWPAKGPCTSPQDQVTLP
ncbi:hypothetical protein GQ457_05G036040 [Hibiscus cannabinus]